MKELDLHGRRHMDPAIRFDIDQFVYEHLIKGHEEAVKIITGNSPKMKDIVREVLQDYWFTIEEGFLQGGWLTIRKPFSYFT